MAALPPCRLPGPRRTTRRDSGCSRWCHVSPEPGIYCVPGALCYARRYGVQLDLAPAFFLGLLVYEDPEVGFGREF